MKTEYSIDGFEDLHDYDEYFIDALNKLDIPDEFQGRIKVTLEYEEYVEPVKETKTKIPAHVTRVRNAVTGEIK